MSRNSKQKRDARKKRQRSGPTPPRGDYFGFGPGCGDPLCPDCGPGSGPAGPRDGARFFRPPNREEELYRLMDAAGASGYGPNRDGRMFADTVARIVEVSGFLAPDRVDSAVSQYLERVVAVVFDRGWQPAEIAHLAARDVGGPETRLLIILIGSHAVQHRAFERAPREWVQQLTELGISPAADTGVAAFRHWQRSERLTGHDFWEPALRVLSRVGSTTELPALLPLPAQWSGGPGRGPGRDTDSKVLKRIRGLLAKAEASEFAEEAESLSAKAQDLMTRYAIEIAMLDANVRTDLTTHVRTRRLLIANPYPDAKTALLNAVGRNNGARVIWHKDAALASIVGMPVDLDLCELLYTSLLVQSSQALREAGTERFARSPSFRRSFLISYATRIGERLAEARDRAAAAAATQYGRELVPVLTRRAEAVNDVFDEQFPDTVAIRHSATNGIGWARGREAAEDADLTGGRQPIRQ